VTTGILKQPVPGRVRLRPLNPDDRQAGLSAPGGPDKAVYAYPIERHEHWRRYFLERLRRLA